MSIDNKPSVDKTETPTPSDVVNKATETKSQEETTENVDIELKLLRLNHKKKQLKMLM